MASLYTNCQNKIPEKKNRIDKIASKIVKNGKKSAFLKRSKLDQYANCILDVLTTLQKLHNFIIT